MDRALVTLADYPITGWQLAVSGAALALFLLAWIVYATLKIGRSHMVDAAVAAERERELDDKMAALAQMNAELSGRMRAMAETVTSRQNDLSRLMAERLDAVGVRVGAGLEQNARSTADHLARLGERMAVIDRAQASLHGLSQEMLSLKDILANKQTRGAFGQGRMEAIVRDGLPLDAYAFQHTLSNRNRPDCVIRLPGDERLMVIDAKFPLEAFTELRAASDDDGRKSARARVRADLHKHIRDIAERYFVAGETQDLAMLFVPSESIYADVQEHFDDVVQKAHRARIMIVSPSLLMLAIQVMQSIVRDSRMREQAHVIQSEVQKLLEDIGRLRERGARLGGHFRQAQDDLDGILTSADKIARRGDRIVGLEFEDVRPEADAAPALAPRAAE